MVSTGHSVKVVGIEVSFDSKHNAEIKFRIRGICKRLAAVFVVVVGVEVVVMVVEGGMLSSLAVATECCCCCCRFGIHMVSMFGCDTMIRHSVVVIKEGCLPPYVLPSCESYGQYKYVTFQRNAI